MKAVEARLLVPPELTEDYVRAKVAEALDEDLGPERRDLSSDAIVPADAPGQARIIAKAPGVVAGLIAVVEVCRQVDPGLAVEARVGDGDKVAAGEVIAEIRGSQRSLLKAERTALNFLQQLSGVATETRRCVDAAAGGRAVILDTRKTAAGLRPLQRYAVLAGGGANHRYNLASAVLIKDNHIEAAGGVGAAMAAARSAGVPVQVEVADFDQLDEALAAGADSLLLDNMSPAQVAQAVARVAGRVPVEASGGLTAANVAAYAAAGVDRISIGGLTHSAPALDISMEVERA